jgi:hypothetical protein
MANLLGQNIGTNYKGILNLNTLNGNLSATLQAVTDGDGNASPLQLSTASVSFGGSTGLNWDNANTRLGIGTNTPLGILHLKTAAATTRLLLDGDAAQNKIITYRTAGVQRFGLYTNNTAESGSNVGSDFAIRAYDDAGTLLSTPLFIKRSTGNVGIGTTAPSARLNVRGSDTTSTTNALLIENSAGTTLLQVKNGGSDRQVVMNSLLVGSFDIAGSIIQVGSGLNAIFRSQNGMAFNSDYSAANASAQLDVKSTTKGFLPPRMTTTEKNAIASPAAGLVVYDTTLAKLCVRTASAWETITSI